MLLSKENSTNDTTNGDIPTKKKKKRRKNKKNKKKIDIPCEGDTAVMDLSQEEEEDDSSSFELDLKNFESRL
jgi:hypothetical protein